MFSSRSRPSSLNLPGHNSRIPHPLKFIVPELLKTNRASVISKGAANTLPTFATVNTWTLPPNLDLPTLHMVVTALLTPPDLSPLPWPPVETSPEENVNEVPPAASRTTTPLGARHSPMEIGVDSQLSHLR